MRIIFNKVSYGIMAVLATKLVAITIYYKRRFKYWEYRNVPFVQPNIPFGSMGNPLVELEAIGLRIRRQYLEFKSKRLKHVGLFNLWIPVYMPIEREYIKNILIDDFNSFVDRGITYTNKNDPSAANLFFVDDHKWKILRKKFQVFTPNNAKIVFPNLLKCGQKLEKTINNVSSKNQPIDVKNILELHVLDVIFNCVFGIDCDNFKEPKSDLIKNVENIFMPNTVKLLQDFIFPLNPKLAQLIGFQFVPKEPADFFKKVIVDTIKARENNKSVHNDYLQIMISLMKNNNKGSQQRRNLTIEELIAQMLLFLIAGYETLTNTIFFCLFELASNPDIQEKARNKIRNVLDKYGGNISYESLEELKYLDQILHETMRKYPILPVLNRRCVKDYQMPGTDLIIEKGTDIVVPIAGLHHDDEYFPNPDNFDPDRFNAENRRNIKPFSYMPFGKGPRFCLAADFAMMQMKLALVILLKNNIFSINNSTELPLKMSPFSIVLTTSKNILFNVKKQ